MKETQHSGIDEKPRMVETGTAKTNLSETSCGSVSDSRRPLVKVEGPRPYGWKDIQLTKS